MFCIIDRHSERRSYWNDNLVESYDDMLIGLYNLKYEHEDSHKIIATANSLEEIKDLFIEEFI
jgi:hypothetical protein